MGIRRQAAVLALGLGVFAAPAAIKAQGGYPQGPPPPPGGYNQQGPPPQQGGYQQGPWEQPPDEYSRDLQRQAFHDGIEGARRDVENHRQPNVNNRDEFRHYRGPERRAYKQAFARGYQTFFEHQGDRPRDGDDRRRDRDRHDDDRHDGDRRDDAPHGER